jgi:hypothetical protein
VAGLRPDSRNWAQLVLDERVRWLAARPECPPEGTRGTEPPTCRGRAPAVVRPHWDWGEELLDAKRKLGAVASGERNGPNHGDGMAITAPSCLRNEPAVHAAYELCSAWFLIALSMPEKIIA